MDNDKKMTGLISETENLVKALTALKQEVESYEVAKNNLVDVRTKLVEVNDSLLVQAENISNYTKKLHTLVNTDLVMKVDKIIEQNNSEMVNVTKSFKITTILVGVSVVLSFISIILQFVK